jgi:hypothetical protein
MPHINNSTVVEKKNNYFPKFWNIIPEHSHSPATSGKMDMKWETVHYVNSKDPRVWGPAFWFTLHNGAASYPEKASPVCANHMKGFILGMPFMIPCDKCHDHARAHIEENYHRLDEIVSGKKHLFNFFVSFHNYVNKRYGKPEMSNEDAYALYNGNTTVTKLTYSGSSRK